MNRRNEKRSGETRTVVVTSGKGGVGKTTSSANLGMSMARLGYSVALVDADIGLRNLDLLARIGKPSGVYRDGSVGRRVSIRASVDSR